MESGKKIVFTLEDDSNEELRDSLETEKSNDNITAYKGALLWFYGKCLLFSAVSFFEIYYIVAIRDKSLNALFTLQDAVCVYTVFSYLICNKSYKSFRTLLLPVAVFLNFTVLKKGCICVVFYAFCIIGSLFSQYKKKSGTIISNALISHIDSVFIGSYIILCALGQNIADRIAVSDVFFLIVLYTQGVLTDFLGGIKQNPEKNICEKENICLNYKKTALFILILMLTGIISYMALLFRVNIVSFALYTAFLSWILLMCIQVDNERFKRVFIKKMKLYVYAQASIFILTIAVYIITNI